MKGVRGRFLRKIKSFSAITALKQGLVFQVNTPSNQCFESQTFHKEQHHRTNSNLHEKVLDTTCLHEKVLDSTNLSAVKTEVEDEKEDLFFEAEDPMREEISKDSSPPDNASKEISIPLDSGVDKASSEEDIINLEKEEHISLLNFEEKCPPGGSESVVFYTTSMSGIRKTFEDCNKIRFLLESIRVVFSERDVSMDMGFREELWRVVGRRVVPPRLFIKGRDIGGVEEVVGLHEQGRLKELLEGIPINPSMSKCSGCGGVHFVLCFKCNGSRKVSNNGDGGEVISVRCVECNENGLVKCNVCC